MDSVARHLVFHAAVVLLFGLLLGSPYGRAINQKMPAHIVNSWRVAHASLPIAAGLMLAIAAVLSSLQVSLSIKWVIAGSLIVSSYAFCISMPMAAITEHRGLTTDGRGLQRIVYLGNILGALTSLIAAAVFLYAAFVSL
jgi:ABC-type polysaccharide/polyol phosphate export permease